MQPSTALTLQHGYRHLGPEQGRRAEGFLREAADMLHMALLTLEGPDAKSTKLATAHRLLVDAVTALARARVYVPGVRTYAANIVTNAERDVDREIGRLHELAALLLWHNHAILPNRQAQPLAPEDEAQLAEVVRDLGLSAKIGRLRYEWFVGLGLCGAMLPVLGLPLSVVAVAAGALAVWVTR